MTSATMPRQASHQLMASKNSKQDNNANCKQHGTDNDWDNEKKQQREEEEKREGDNDGNTINET